MHCKTFVGIDVSKSTFDAFIHGTDHHKQFPNLERGFESLCKWIGLLQSHTELKDVHVIDTLKEQIQRVDAAMKLIIELDPELKLTFDLITGIKGVGKTV